MHNKCKKKKFDKIKAMFILAECIKSKNHKRREIRAYFCNECHAWHLTSKK